MPLPPAVRILSAALVVLLAVACTPASPQPDSVAVEATMQPADRVNVTLYFRHGRGPSAYLVPVVREVPVEADLHRLALRLLLEGPRDGDPPGLSPVMPRSTRILGLGVADGTAEVDLSGDVVTHAGRLARRPEHEVLALAALANTLTEFPAITRVSLRVEGQRPKRFWGVWGAPDVLVRDDSVIEPQGRRELYPAVTGFSPGPQQLRQPERLGEGPATPTVVTNVTVKPRTTYLRVTVEVSGPQGGALERPVPAAAARRVGDDIVLTVDAPARPGIGGDLSETYHDPEFPAARAEVRPQRRAVVVAVTPRQHGRDFWLHTLGEPARVVLDIRR